jgi:SAM-dependent methyltransferase
LLQSEVEERAGSIYTTITACRSCGEGGLLPVLSLGSTPLADALPTAQQLDDSEYVVPLDVVFCSVCSLLQIAQTVDPDVLFCRDYPYFSSVSPSLMRHFADSAEALIERNGLDRNSLVIEAASNDGYMLKVFQEHGIPVLGIDPAEGPATAANVRGVKTLNDFFTVKLAQNLRAAGMQADLFLANNVLAHVADLNGFVEGFATLLKPTGTAVIECPYVADLVKHLEFDTIYHQHLCYFSVTALDRLFRRHGLFLNRVERTPIHGGSLRLFVSPFEAVEDSVRERLQEEAAAGLMDFGYYRDFAKRIDALRDQVMRTLRTLKRDGKRIAAYGAAAKANTLLSYFGIDTDLVDYIADLNPFKIGRFMGGCHIPIVDPAEIARDQPDILLILAWNFATEIMNQQEPYRARGGTFMIPIPELRFVSKDVELAAD